MNDQSHILDVREPLPASNGKPVITGHRSVEWYPMTNDTQREKLRLVSAWNGHPNMLGASHVLLKRDSDIVGCTSIGQIAFAPTWLHTEKVRAHDALSALRDVGVFLRNMGFKGVVTVADDASPLGRELPRMGFKDLGTVRLWLKELLIIPKG